MTTLSTVSRAATFEEQCRFHQNPRTITLAGRDIHNFSTSIATTAASSSTKQHNPAPLQVDPEHHPTKMFRDASASWEEETGL
jgi:hypothetical protein